ncbi:MAG: efflux RND transporter periplasmic adaptor subunit [Chloroflexi bacterium]|nr:efflux RND transporter periplasmic adaptor subunit [Chloroflexota bacterium]
MTKIFNGLFAVICVSMLFISGISCDSKTSAPEEKKQVATVQRGNLAITVSVDGNLVMPQAFDLRFGAPGDVKDVLVEEGDFVKEGQVLATLDDTTQRLDIMLANNSVQTVLSNLYQTVPRLPQFPTKGPDSGSGVGYPFYYPNATALLSFARAQDEVSRARELFQSENYTAAASELYVALADLEFCIAILEDTINNPKSGLGNMAPFVPTDSSGITYFQIQQDQSFESVYIVQLRKAVDLIKQGQTDIENVRVLLAQGKYDEAAPMFNALFSRVKDIGKVITNNVNVIRARNYTTVYGKEISFSLFRAAEEKLNAALKGIESGGLNSPELHDNLRIAQHYMEICNAILGSNDYVLKHGLSLKNEQQYNVDLANALVTLGNKKDDFLKTIILAPFDGTVVSVGVKKNDVLSAMDYSSKTAVQLVDTSQIKFQGLVDEIDILKVKTGQKAMISVDAVPDKEFPGTVTFISPYGAKDTGTVVKFAVTIKLDPTDVELKGGLTATADIAVASVQNVLLVPISAITTTSAGTFVTVINEDTGQTEKKKVTLGNQNYRFAEVLTGLEEGDKVTIEEKVTGAPVTTGFPRPQGPPSR